MKKFRELYISFLLVSFSFFSSGCSEDNSVIPDFNIFPVSKDVQLGESLDRQIKSEPSEYPLLEDQYALNYVNGILDEVLTSPDIEYSEEFDYNIQIIDKDVINAFAAPGGYIYVYTGLMEFLDNEATLASVIAHEVAHCEERHATQRMTKQYGISILTDIVLGDNPSALEEIGANLLTGIGLLQNSRADEYEADEKGFNYLLSTQWYPGAGIYFFDKIQSNKEAGFLESLLSTHPMPDDRVDKLQKLIENNSSKFDEPSENNLFSQRYSDFLQQL